jgi:hypothetical protein
MSRFSDTFCADADPAISSHLSTPTVNHNNVSILPS